jgi:hypothetical protein
MNKSFVFVTFQQEGIHRYPEAATDPTLATRRFGKPEDFWLDVAFLADLHRHIFHFRIDMEVFHDNRDVEFIQLKRTIQRWYSSETLQLNHKSCEMMARDLYSKLIENWPNRDYVIEVSEDGENGCKMFFNREE